MKVTHIAVAILLATSALTIFAAPAEAATCAGLSNSNGSCVGAYSNGLGTLRDTCVGARSSDGHCTGVQV